MELLLGMDVGGVNVKATSVPRDRAGTLARDAWSTKVHYPLWKHSINDLHATLERVLVDHARHHERDDNPCSLHVAASITGELSDAFVSKVEGISVIVQAVTRALDNACRKERMKRGSLRFTGTDDILRTSQEAIQEHRLVAAANWHATATWAGCTHPDCIFIDCGSTTTDIIPVLDGTPSPSGRTDLDRLRSGELVYTGALRATIPSIAHQVPVNGTMVPVSFETFALMADVHLILGHIDEASYDCETADGRSTSLIDAKRRLARVVCEDLDVLGEENVMRTCRFLHGMQVSSIAKGLEKVMEHLRQANDIEPGTSNCPCVVTGLGAPFLARPAALTAGATTIVTFPDSEDTMTSIASSSLGVVHVLSRFLDDGDDRAT